MDGIGGQQMAIEPIEGGPNLEPEQSKIAQEVLEHLATLRSLVIQADATVTTAKQEITTLLKFIDKWKKQ
jgi:hypothetical protein